ncbi:MAG: hypothetical protein J6B44_03365, partial [Muribaculaceae bacterium]|nr:hypothetical protein [Muribaculaceae bacterium]
VFYSPQISCGFLNHFNFSLIFSFSAGPAASAADLPCGKRVQSYTFFISPPNFFQYFYVIKHIFLSQHIITISFYPDSQTD